MQQLKANTSFRAFFAIEIPDDIKQKILPQINKIKSHPALQNHKWVKSEKWHLTLRFLGNITQTQHQCLLEKLNAAIKNFHEFSLELTGLLPFPNENKMHALILQPKNIYYLTTLALSIDKIALSCGIAPDNHSFNPHITVARLNSNKIPLTLLTQNKISAINFLVNEIKLIKSEPGIAGSVYTTLNNFILQKPL